MVGPRSRLHVRRTDLAAMRPDLCEEAAAGRRGVPTTKDQMPTDDNRLSLTEVAERLGVHYMTVYRYVRPGRLPAARVRRTWEVDPAALDAFLGGPVPSAPAGRARYPELLQA